MQMIEDVIEKLDIQDGDRILDFGGGWGCDSNYILAKLPNVQFTGINLSHHQCEYMRLKMQDSESYLSSGLFTLYEGDLNDAQFETKFDKILSLGFFCHVGYLTQAFQKLASFLKDKGRVFIQIITVRTPNNISSVFTHKYIFPRNRYWKYGVPNYNKDLQILKNWYLNGYHYSTTFAKWVKNLDDSQAIVKDLDYSIDYGKFRRIWQFYLMWFVANFAVCDGEYNGNG